MNTISTILTTSGNSVAVRLPKNLIQISGIGKQVTLEAKKDTIIIRNVSNARSDWREQIRALVATTGGDDTMQEFADMHVSANDGLDDLPWEGILFEDWVKNNAKLS